MDIGHYRMRAICINKANAKCSRCKITHPKMSWEVHFNFYFIFDFFFFFYSLNDYSLLSGLKIIYNISISLRSFNIRLIWTLFILYFTHQLTKVFFFTNGKIFVFEMRHIFKKFLFQLQKQNVKKAKGRKKNKSLKGKTFTKLLKIRQREQSSFPFNGINLCVGT